MISIHASHAGCDSYTTKTLDYGDNFNPRIPCGMRRLMKGGKHDYKRFQSTHPMRDATVDHCFLLLVIYHFNPRIPCGMRPDVQVLRCHFDLISIHASHAGCDLIVSHWQLHVLAISIHASHAGCDLFIIEDISTKVEFQSTHPMRDATACMADLCCQSRISIHASHAGCDLITEIDTSNAA